VGVGVAALDYRQAWCTQFNRDLNHIPISKVSSKFKLFQTFIDQKSIFLGLKKLK
jgi:hypothetical protein